MTNLVYQSLKAKVYLICEKLNLSKFEKSTGRKLVVPIPEIVTLALYKQTQGIPTKKSVWNDFKETLKCSYKTLVVNINRFATLALFIFNLILKLNQEIAHIVKHTDSTDIPVCLNKNAKHCKTMKPLSSWGHSGKGLTYGLKMSITTDLKRNLLGVRFGTGNCDDRETFKKLNKDLMGIFVADAGYISEKLEKDFHIEGKRILFVKPRKNMKKIITSFQNFLYSTRMIIELNFRNLKMFYGLITSLPRSIDGHFANYIYSLLAYVLR